MSSELTAKLTLTGDSSGAVAAANETSAALDKVKASAAEAGAAGGAMAAPYNAATAAIAGQAAATEAANKALTASGAAKVDEIARLTQLASASTATTSNITALSAAHSKYNSEVNAARALLAGGTINQTQYAAAVDAASAKLALSNVVHDANNAALLKESGGAQALKAAQAELGEGAEETSVHIEGLTRQMEHVAAASGVGLGNARLLVYGFRDLAAVAATPVGALVLVGAALAAVVVAAESYQASIGKLNTDIETHGDVLHLVGGDYQALASQIADAADVSEREGRSIVEYFVDAGAQSAAAVKMAADAVQGYSTMTGESADKAAQNIARMFTDPATAAQELTKEYGLFSDAQLQQIQNLQDSGDKMQAQEIVIDALKEKVNGLTNETTSLGGAWDAVSKALSNAWDWVGKFAGTQLPSWLQWLDPTLSGAGGPTQPENITLSQDAQAWIAQKNQLSQQAGDIMRGLNIGGQTTVTDTYNKEIVLQKAYNEGLLTEQQYTQALTAIDKEQLDAVNKSTDAKQKLDSADKAHLDTIKHLIDAGPERIALANADAQALQKEADASDGTTQSIKQLQQAYDISKAVQPYVTALDQAQQLYQKNIINASQYAQMVTKLKSDIESVTLAMKSQQAAQDELAAKQQARSAEEGLTTFYSSLGAAKQGIEADAQFIEQKTAEVRDLQVQAAQEEAQAQINALDFSQQGWQQYFEFILDGLQNKIAKAYAEDTARRTDWAAGVSKGFTQLTNDTQNWAKTSEQFTTQFATQFEDTLVKMVEGGKNSLATFFQWIEEQLLKLLYQQYLSSFFNGLFQDIANGLGDWMGFDGAGGGAGGGGGFGGTGGMHDGGVVGRDASFMRQVPMALFLNAPRFHSGGPILAPGEVPIIAKAGERVLTEMQANAVDAALARPVILQFPANANDKPPVQVNIQQGPGTQATASEPTRGADGSFSIDVIVEQIDRSMAQRSKYGRSAYTQSLENTHGLQRKPFG